MFCHRFVCPDGQEDGQIWLFRTPDLICNCTNNVLNENFNNSKIVQRLIIGWKAFIPEGQSGQSPISPQVPFPLSKLKLECKFCKGRFFMYLSVLFSM